MVDSDTSFEQQYYENDDFWKEENITEADNHRIERLSTMIPKDVDTILDVGCGGGIFLNYLQKSHRFGRLCGVDRSSTALQYVKTEKREASIESLPFNDGEFDMVSCLEVLEHLPVPVYEKALEELSRVSKKYILISAPNDEKLQESLIQCPLCYTKFNPNYHMRTFNQCAIKNLFAKQHYECINAQYIGENKSYIWMKWLGKLQFPKKKRKKDFPGFTICPVCGYRKDCSPTKNAAYPVEKHNINGAAKDKIKKWVEKKSPIKLNYRWIAGLYVNSNEKKIGNR